MLDAKQVCFKLNQEDHLLLKVAAASEGKSIKQYIMEAVQHKMRNYAPKIKHKG